MTLWNVVDETGWSFADISANTIEGTHLLLDESKKISVKRCRQRKKERKGKAVLSKKLKNLGLEYYSRSGQLRKGKSLGQKCAGKCSYKCSEFSDEARQVIFDKFWAIGNRAEQWSVLAKHVKKAQVKQRSTSASTLRSCTCYYYLPLVNDDETTIFGEGQKLRVCKSTFLQTFCVNGTMVVTALKKQENERSFFDRRGGHRNRVRVITGSMAESVCDHVLSFDPQESRNETNELILFRPLSIKRMYDLYNKWFDPKKYESQCPSLRIYRDIANKNFKITFRSS